MNVTEAVRSFFTRFPLKTYRKRELILHAGDPVNSVFYIVAGRVSQYDITPNGNEVVVNIFKPGAFFPMSSAINATDNAYFFEASLETQVRVAPKADVIDFLHAHPDVVFDLLSRVYRGVDGVLRRMAHLMGGDAQSRCIFELLNSAHRFGEPRNDGVFIATTESELARRSGLARETISRMLQNLKTAGLIDVGRSGLTIKSTADLEARLGTSL